MGLGGGVSLVALLLRKVSSSCLSSELRETSPMQVSMPDSLRFKLINTIPDLLFQLVGMLLYLEELLFP